MNECGFETNCIQLQSRETLQSGVKNALKVSGPDLYEPHTSLQQLRTIKFSTMAIGGDHDAIPVLHTDRTKYSRVLFSDHI